MRNGGKLGAHRGSRKRLRAKSLRSSPASERASCAWWLGTCAWSRTSGCSRTSPTTAPCPACSWTRSPDLRPGRVMTAAASAGCGACASSHAHAGQLRTGSGRQGGRGPDQRHRRGDPRAPRRLLPRLEAPRARRHGPGLDLPPPSRCSRPAGTSRTLRWRQCFSADVRRMCMQLDDLDACVGARGSRRRLWAVFQRHCSEMHASMASQRDERRSILRGSPGRWRGPLGDAADRRRDQPGLLQPGTVRS